MNEEDDCKWSCHVCTYSNWPSAVKCTMCRAKKQALGDEIYSLQGGIHPDIVAKQSCARAVTPELPTWTCLTCTYNNNENVTHCIQCETTRRRVRSPKNTNIVVENSILNFKNDRYSCVDKDEFDLNIRKISKSNSQNLGSTTEKAAIIKSNSQNILESSLYLSHKKNLDKKSPEKVNLTQNIRDRDKRIKGPDKNVVRERDRNLNAHELIREREKNVIRERTLHGSEHIDSNIISESMDRGSPCLNNQRIMPKPFEDRDPERGGPCLNNQMKPFEERDNINERAKSNMFTSVQINRNETPCGSNKWCCIHCTYENWPKTVTCVMCGLGQNPLPERSSAALESPDCDNARGLPQSLNEENYISSLRRSGSRRFEPIEQSAPARKQVSPNNCEMERRLRLSRPSDLSWLEACIGVVDGDANPVEAYLASGGDPARYLTTGEVALLNRPSAFDTGYTLVHLAIRFHREDMLAMLLSRIEGGGSGVKRVPSYVAPDLAADIRRRVSATLRQRKGGFPCYFVTEITTFSLPAEVEDLSTSIQNQMFEELLDKEVQSQLESDPPVVNWSLEITVRLGSRLYALWNRSAGDCLLDSVMQATWGVFDRENVLRRTLAESLEQGSHLFYPRWKEYEARQATLLHFSLDETQYEEDWAALLSLANQPGSSLDQLHVFALAHILRRPIIVYGVKFVKSFRGENLGFARFEGVYLPLLWEPSFCVRSPLVLGYTRGHFSALVPLEPYNTLNICPSKLTSADNEDNSDHLQVTFLPLMDRDRKMLSIHFLSHEEAKKEEAVLREWMDVCVTEGGILVAQQKLHKRPLLVAQMLEEWLNHYRRIDQMSQAPFNLRVASVQEAEYSSEVETDDE